jgi:hypothetical protein
MSTWEIGKLHHQSSSIISFQFPGYPIIQYYLIACPIFYSEVGILDKGAGMLGIVYFSGRADSKRPHISFGPAGGRDIIPLGAGCG